MTEWPERFADVVRTHITSKGTDASLIAGVPLRDQGIDSLAAVGLIMDLEIEFEFEFPDDLVTMETMETPESLWAVVAKLSETT
jgi:acyl carrier protein